MGGESSLRWRAMGDHDRVMLRGPRPLTGAREEGDLGLYLIFLFS